MKTLKTTLTTYNFDTRNKEELTAYKALHKQLKKEGLRIFDVIDTKGNIYKQTTREVSLDTTHLFNNQWNTTDDQRIFDWYEAILTNKHIKRGYYLTQTPEMREIRSNTYKCGYCGHQYYKPTQTTCDHCLGSDYLTPEYFNLLKLQPISKDTPKNKRVALTESEHVAIKAAWEVQHAETMRLKAQKKINATLADIQAKTEALQKEREIVEWCITNNVFLHIDPSNLIYYSHKDMTTFGWRSSAKGIAPLVDALTSAPFNYEIV